MRLEALGKTALVGAILVASCAPSGRTGDPRGRGGADGGQAGAGGAAPDGGGGPGGGGSGGAPGGGGPVGGLDAASDRMVSSWDGSGPGCGEMTTPIPYTPRIPDVLVVFDASGSMSQRFGTGTRLTVEQAIVRDLLRAYQDRIRFGYQEFPMNTAKVMCAQGSCCAASVAVSPELNNFPPIDRAMRPCGGEPNCSSSRNNTPTPDALRLAREFYATLNDGIKDRYVLLSTDGEPNCLIFGTSGNACDQSVAEIEKLAAIGVKTIVLGVSEEVASSACLERMGVAGGVPRPNAPPSYYPGSDPDSLKAYLEQIVAGIAKPSCKIDLQTQPPNPDKVAVFFDTTQVPWDPGHADGWDYAAGSTSQIVVYGSWCRNLEGFKVKVIDVRFGCRPCGATVSCE